MFIRLRTDTLITKGVYCKSYSCVLDTSNQFAEKLPIPMFSPKIQQPLRMLDFTEHWRISVHVHANYHMLHTCTSIQICSTFEPLETRRILRYEKYHGILGHWEMNFHSWHLGNLHTSCRYVWRHLNNSRMAWNRFWVSQSFFQSRFLEPYPHTFSLFRLIVICCLVWFKT